MKILIIEDEKPAAEKLELLLRRYDSAIEILGIIGSVKKAVEWFTENASHPDVVFLDIQLSDGQSFEIFSKTEVRSPIIFVTAYNEFAIDAFRVNSIDYILKPISKQAIEQSLQKLQNLKNTFSNGKMLENAAAIQNSFKSGSKTFKTRFMVRVADRIKSVETETIDLFFAEGRDVFLQTDTNKKYLIEYKLEDLLEILDPKIFFRVSRSFILNIKSIQNVIIHSGSRLKIVTNNKTEREIIVSRDKVKDFKLWFDGSL